MRVLRYTARYVILRWLCDFLSFCEITLRTIRYIPCNLTHSFPHSMAAMLCTSSLLPPKALDFGDRLTREHKHRRTALASESKGSLRWDEIECWSERDHIVK